MTPKTHHASRTPFRTALFWTSSCALLFTLPFVISCASERTRREAAVRVLDQENVLIQKLREERQTQAIAQKVIRDSTLKAAEERLLQAFEALQNATQTLRETL